MKNLFTGAEELFRIKPEHSLSGNVRVFTTREIFHKQTLEAATESYLTQKQASENCFHITPENIALFSADKRGSFPLDTLFFAANATVTIERPYEISQHDLTAALEDSMLPAVDKDRKVVLLGEQKSMEKYLVALQRKYPTKTTELSRLMGGMEVMESHNEKPQSFRGLAENWVAAALRSNKLAPEAYTLSHTLFPKP